MKRFNKLFLSILFMIGCVLNIHSEDRYERYVGLKSSTLYLDKTFSHTSNENSRIYDRYNEFSLVGVEIQAFEQDLDSILAGFGASMEYLV